MAPALQRTASQELRAALRPGHERTHTTTLKRFAARVMPV
jgi:hypothetical protein